MVRIGSPILRELIDEWTQKATQKAARKVAERHILIVLVARFGPEARALETELKKMGGSQLDKLIEPAATCPDLESFRNQLPPRRRRRRT
jgi:hypothetical protein